MRNLRFLLAVSLAAALPSLTACDASSGNAGTPADTADGAADAIEPLDTTADVPADTVQPTGPILDHPGTQSHVCVLDKKDAVPFLGMSAGGTVAAGADGFLVTQCRQSGFGGDGVEGGVFGHWAGVTGKTSEPFAIGASDGGYDSDCQSASTGDTVTVVWARALGGGGAQVHAARVNATGQVVLGPLAVPGVADPNGPRVYQLIAKGEQALLLWGTNDKVKATLLGADLKPVGGSSDLPPAWSYNLRGAKTSTGFLVAWDQSSDLGWTEVWAVATDDSGKPVGSAWRISTTATAKLSTSLGDLVPFGDGFMVALTVRTTLPGTGGGFGEGSSASVTALQRLGTDGKPVGVPREVQTAVADFEHVDPALEVVGDDVVLTWAFGSVIYICGGCVGDHDLRFVRLHGADLSTASNVLELPRTGINGLKRPELAAQSDRLAVTYDIDFHAMTKSGAALLTCGAK
jgi:hypothetical protein